jgi:hypothetical protein
LSGLTAIMPEGREIESEDGRMESILLARSKGVNRHWIFDVMQQRRT